MIKNIRTFFHNLSVQRKILISFLCICILCFSALFCIGVPQLARSFRENIFFSADQSQEQAQEYISYMMNSLKQTCYSFAYDTDVVEIASKSDSGYSIQQQSIDQSVLSNYIVKSKSGHYKTISDIKLYLNDDFSYVSPSGNTFLSFDLIFDTEWYQAMKNTPYAYYLIPPQWNQSPNRISVVHMISHPNDYSHFIGALMIDIPVRNVKEILKNCTVTPNSYAYLINDEGILVCSSIEEPIMIGAEKLTTSFEPQYQYSDQNNFYSLYRLNSCDWTLVQVIPNKDIWDASFSSIRYFIIISICMLAVSILLSVRISTSITNRIHLLSKTMRNFRYNKSDVVPAEKNGDDVDYLLASYNQLISDFEELTTENIQKSQKLNETELTLLHSQIKPHFLYNTLDMIRTLANHKQIDKASAAISALSGFYKSGLGNRTLWSTLNNEIQHVRSYMDIQKLRYGEQITLDIQIPDEFLDVNLPRITLQPIVENALIHGILNCSDKQGIITICASCAGTSNLLISIRDNGCGMSRDTLLTLFQSNQFGKGIGLWNTNERIRIHYGSTYGLSVQSIPNEYTEISIRVPIMRGKEFSDDNTDS